MGSYNRKVHKQVLIRYTTKSQLDEYIRQHGLGSYNAAIMNLLTLWRNQSPAEPVPVTR